jgi:hypothetical protein
MDGLDEEFQLMTVPKALLFAALALGALVVAVRPVGLRAQAPATTTPHAAGTVKAISASGITVTAAGGVDYTVAVPAEAKILDVAPGSKDLKSATPGVVGDIAIGDKVIVTGSATDTGTTLTAVRVILMKQAAIAQTHADEAAAWQQGGGGIVKSVNASTGTIVISSALKTVTVQTTATTIVRRYAGDSVKFEDAVASTVAAIQPGDQLRVRGTKSADGLTVTAEEIVTGEFKNYSGVISAINPPKDGGTAGTVTLKDLTTKKTVTVTISANSDVRRIPAEMATRFAARVKGGGAAGAPAGGAAGGEGAGRRAGMDLSQMLARLPTETLGGLKVGEAVMIVANAPGGASAAMSAVTLLAGVEPILAAQPAGESMTLSPWSLGGGGAGGADAP